ncbi:hypothetical protein ACXYRQ_00405 [Mycoplasma sp. 394]
MRTKFQIKNLDSEVIEFLNLDESKKHITNNQIIQAFIKQYQQILFAVCHKIQNVYFDHVFSFDEILNAAYYELLQMLKTKRNQQDIPFANYFWSMLKYRIINFFNAHYGSQSRFENKIGRHNINFNRLQNKLSWYKNFQERNNKNEAYVKLISIMHLLNEQERNYLQNLLNNNKMHYTNSKQKEITTNIRAKITDFF